jgi:uncharacterized membrane protein YphA (DoxX/SURF4 family)
MKWLLPIGCCRRDHLSAVRGQAVRGANLRKRSSKDTNEMEHALDEMVKRGRLLFAIAVMASGAEQLICARFGLAVGYIIPGVPGNPFSAYLIGIALLAAGLSIAINRRARLSAFLLGVVFLLCVLLVWIHRAAERPLSGSVRTVVFETLACCGSAFTLAGLLPAEKWFSGRWESSVDGLIKSGPYLFAASSVVFGIDHFLFLGAIASLVPAWIPGSGLFWAYLTGAVFVAAGVGIAANWMARWGATLLGTMFLLWFLVLHSPRAVRASVSHSPNSPSEWSSAFIALAMCGGAWISAWHFQQSEKEKTMARDGAQG